MQSSTLMLHESMHTQSAQQIGISRSSSNKVEFSLNTVNSGVPRLPVELILQIIDCVTYEDCSLLALSPTSLVTKTLLSFRLVCRASYPHATRQLFNRCLYIASPLQIRSLARSLEGHLRQSKCSTEAISVQPVNIRSNLHTLYLAPFTNYDYGTDPGLEHHLATNSLHRVLGYMAPTLRKLVLDINKRPCGYAEDQLLILRAVISGLPKLEDLAVIKVATDSYDDWPTPAMPFDHIPSAGRIPEGRLWPSLRRLAIRSMGCGARIAAFIKSLWLTGKLETAIIICTLLSREDLTPLNDLFQHPTAPRKLFLTVCYTPLPFPRLDPIEFQEDSDLTIRVIRLQDPDDYRILMRDLALDETVWTKWGRS